MWKPLSQYVKEHSSKISPRSYTTSWMITHCTIWYEWNVVICFQAFYKEDMFFILFHTVRDSKALLGTNPFVVEDKDTNLHICAADAQDCRKTFSGTEVIFRATSIRPYHIKPMGRIRCLYNVLSVGITYMLIHYSCIQGMGWSKQWPLTPCITYGPCLIYLRVYNTSI